MFATSAKISYGFLQRIGASSGWSVEQRNLSMLFYSNVMGNSVLKLSHTVSLSSLNYL